MLNISFAILPPPLFLLKTSQGNCCLVHTHSVCSAAAAKLLQSCPTLCDPIDGSPPGSPDPGILQVRTLEWVAISFSMSICSYTHISAFRVLFCFLRLRKYKNVY